MNLDMVGEKCFLEILICLCEEGDRWSLKLGRQFLKIWKPPFHRKPIRFGTGHLLSC